ncbi:uncharacterized protein G2W53_025813 [Senna tora]|uniref:Uncharacterized protein n=1 Tax=Senna tora TaxID=362788 RepID=A0A834TE93_9FABA|nr:uncharacterized protein G2W53_025813 [Senna tora]
MAEQGEGLTIIPPQLEKRFQAP